MSTTSRRNDTRTLLSPRGASRPKTDAGGQHGTERVRVHPPSVPPSLNSAAAEVLAGIIQRLRGSARQDGGQRKSA
jgi:hypothetical protein